LSKRKEGQARRSSERAPDLHGDEAVVDHDLLGQKIGANGGLILIGELGVDELVHQRGLADAISTMVNKDKEEDQDHC